MTPDLFRDADDTPTQGSRLYTWLMPAYQKNASPLLAKHLDHRRGDELRNVSRRLGWLAWVDFNLVRPGTCGWLDSPPSR